MDDGSAGAAGIVFIFLLVLTYIVSGYNAAIHSFRIEDSGEDDRTTKRAKKIQKVLSGKSDFIDTIQLITTGCSLILGAYCGAQMNRIIGRFVQDIFSAVRGPVLATVISAVLTWIILLFLILTFAIDIPKRLGAHHPEKWIDRLSGFVYVLICIFRPLTFLISKCSSGILYLAGVRGTTLRGDVTEEEIRSMLEEGHEQGVIQKTEADMIANIFEFSEKEAGDIMTHRNDMIAIESGTTLRNAITFMLSKHNSRFPVYTDNIDQIIGIVHLRDVVKYRENNIKDQNAPLWSLQGVIRPAVFVPETKDIDDLFAQMQKEKTQMVIVIDEYGQTAGLIAMEDILEEIVGNILDEYDVDENHIFPTGNRGEFVLDGRTPLEEVKKRFGIDFGDTQYETINGFLISQMDRIPDPNDRSVITYRGWQFRILSVEDHCVHRVMLTRPDASGPARSADERIQ